MVRRGSPMFMTAAPPWTKAHDRNDLGVVTT
jgi:hypothetical protein